MRPFFLFISITCFVIVAWGQVASWLSQGNENYRKGEYGLAENFYKRALEADPKNATAKFNLANALQKQQKFNEAARLMEELGTVTKDTALAPLIWYNQGVAYTKLKNLEASIESYKKSLRINPNDQDVRENLEKALLEQKKQQSQQKNESKSSKMSQKEAEQKLKLLEQKEKELQQKQQNRKKQGAGQAEDW